jgi:hypothetical protein
MVRLKLKRFMRQRGVTEIALANTIADIAIELKLKRSASERHLRYVVQNTEPMLGEPSEHRPSMVVLGLIIKALRRLTKEDLGVSDVLEYQTITPETVTDFPEIVLEDDKEPEKNSPIVVNYELVPIESDAENSKTLDEVWELIVHSLENRGYSKLSQQMAKLYEDYQNETTKAEPQSKRRPQNLPILLIGLLTVSLGYIILDNLVFKPRMIARYTGLFSFRDRVRPTSDLPVPTLIGPEGTIDQLTPTLRISSVPGAVGYDFYVENSVSNDGVYTGPSRANSFVIPENTLCPNTTYSWRARTLGKDGWTSFSSPLEFTVSNTAVEPSQDHLFRLATIKRKPNTPKILAPIGTSNTTTPTLEVKAAPDIYGYGFYIRDLQDDRLVYDNNFVNGNTIKIPEGVLKDGGVYQWNVRSRNCHYWSEFSPAQVFTVNVNE